MRLIKLFAYSLLGYVLYELYLGMTEGIDSDSPVSFGSARPAGAKGGARRGGAGKNAVAEDANGARSSHAVGRGVVR